MIFSFCKDMKFITLGFEFTLFFGLDYFEDGVLVYLQQIKI